MKFFQTTLINFIIFVFQVQFEFKIDLCRVGINAINILFFKQKTFGSHRGIRVKDEGSAFILESNI